MTTTLRNVPTYGDDLVERVTLAACGLLSQSVVVKDTTQFFSSFVLEFDNIKDEITNKTKK